MMLGKWPQTEMTTKSTLFLTTTEIPTQFPEKLKNGSFYTVVQCKVPKILTVLEETVPSALNRKLVDKLILKEVPPSKEHTLARLPNNWLKNVRIKQFEVLNSVLSGDFIWYGNPFEEQVHSLVSFTASRCYLTGALTYDMAGTINTRGLDSLSRIEVIDFSYNHLTVVTGSAFLKPPTNLTTVILSYNSIEKIEGNAFQHSPLLKHVNLSHNLLESVSRAIFAAPARQLEHLDLSWNSLTVLPHDFFNNMPALRKVNLEKNFFYSMPKNPWAVIWTQLKYLDITGKNFIKWC
ncbi:leucine-rich repeat-containing G-protein coupled receptor 5-like [Stegodyphus dumicola]|uniref:leucine-rich repeat-containing G-protein coupled receptor 5-like n=1 Tax=Stegodyphus dumicola TaxID=202533 RepID=UPI0015AD7D87|nr:leucine-rich repeat-containing G-protein coupled receptor 5-like [Stegodyphus dumicola]